MTSRLRSLRRAKGLTLHGLAAVSHSSPATLVFIERYGHRPALTCASESLRRSTSTKVSCGQRWLRLRNSRRDANEPIT